MEKQEAISQISETLKTRINKYQSTIDEFKKKVADGGNWDVIQAIEWRSAEVFEAYWLVNELTELQEFFNEVKSVNKDNELFLEELGKVLQKEINSSIKSLLGAFFDGSSTNPIANVQEIKKCVAKCKITKICRDLLEIMQEAGIKIDIPQSVYELL